MSRTDDGGVIGPQESRQQCCLHRPEVDIHEHVVARVEAEQRRLLTEDATVDAVTNHHRQARGSVIGSIGPVLFHPATKLGIHQDRGVGTDCRCHRCEQQVECYVKIRHQLAVPTERMTILTTKRLFVMRVEATMRCRDSPSTNTGVEQSRSHQHLAADVRRPVWNVLHRRTHNATG